uniref:Uncharacterized protein n=1 Tax=Arundo donax TaxID=35708 RepID=A0A0A9B877_ARUDO
MLKSQLERIYSQGCKCLTLILVFLRKPNSIPNIEFIVYKV